MSPSDQLPPPTAWDVLPWESKPEDGIETHERMHQVSLPDMYGDHCRYGVPRRENPRGRFAPPRRPLARARRATTTPRQETHDSSGGGDGSGDDGHLFFSLSKFHLGGGGGVPRGSWKKRGAGRTTRSPRRAQGVAGWLGSGCADPERCNCPNERPSHDDDENPSVWLSETNATGGRDSR